VEVTGKVKAAFDVDRVTKRFNGQTQTTEATFSVSG
jgi:hypothetical protein